MILAVLGGVAVWSRRGESSVDPPGVRSLATFQGAEEHVTAEEREAQKRDGRGALGRGLATQLATRLRERGLVVEAPAAEDYGWALTMKVEREPAYLLLGATEEPAGPTTRWALSVLDQGGNPGPPSALAHVDAALRAVSGVEDVLWHKRERHLAGNLSSGAEHPVES